MIKTLIHALFLSVAVTCSAAVQIAWDFDDPRIERGTMPWDKLTFQLHYGSDPGQYTNVLTFQSVGQTSQTNTVTLPPPQRVYMAVKAIEAVTSTNEVGEVLHSEIQSPFSNEIAVDFGLIELQAPINLRITGSDVVLEIKSAAQAGGTKER